MNLLEHITQEKENNKANYVTMISKKNEIGFCFKVSVKNNCCFVHVLTGGISEKNFTYLGRFFTQGKTFLIAPEVEGQIEQKAFSYLYKNALSEKLQENYTILRKYKSIVY